jgi:hypothetical protein
MSSHREAPSISKDPVADNTDTYAFVTDSDTVTIITNYLPAQTPAGGPNFYEFGSDVLYEVHIDNDGDGKADVSYQFSFSTMVRTESFLYNTGPITSLDSEAWNRPEEYHVVRVKDGSSRRIGSHLPCPPCHIGPRSTPDYAGLAADAVRSLPSGEVVFAGQRADPFFVDLGSIFDLGTLRPFQGAHVLGKFGSDSGVDTLANANVHTIAIQVPIAFLTRDGQVPTDPLSELSVIGIWGSASRQKGRVNDEEGQRHGAGPWVQVSRLGNPLFNEVIVPMSDKDRWNAFRPHRDDEFAHYVAQPELARLLPVLYPGVFPNLAAYTADRADLLAILLTGIPEGIIPGFQNYTGSVQADMLRLNVAIPPSADPKRLGLLEGDLAGFPNGRRLTDDVVSIELRAVAGATIPLVDPTYTPDAAAGAIEDGTFQKPRRDLLGGFPYVGRPYSGYFIP